MHRREVTRHQHQINALGIKPLELTMHIGYRKKLHLLPAFFLNGFAMRFRPS